jgi:hypothetical protein
MRSACDPETDLPVATRCYRDESKIRITIQFRFRLSIFRELTGIAAD